MSEVISSMTHPYEFYPDCGRGCAACGETDRGLLYLDRRTEVYLCVPCIKAMLEFAEGAAAIIEVGSG